MIDRPLPVLREQRLEKRAGSERYCERRQPVQEPVQQVGSVIGRIVASPQQRNDLAAESGCRLLPDDLHGEVDLLAQVPHAENPARQRRDDEGIQELLRAQAVAYVWRADRRGISGVHEAVE